MKQYLLMNRCANIMHKEHVEGTSSADKDVFVAISFRTTGESMPSVTVIMCKACADVVDEDITEAIRDGR